MLHAEASCDWRITSVLSVYYTFILLRGFSPDAATFPQPTLQDEPPQIMFAELFSLETRHYVGTERANKATALGSLACELQSCKMPHQAQEKKEDSISSLDFTASAMPYQCHSVERASPL